MQAMSLFTSDPPDVSALVVGDVMLDRYLQGKVTRISPEAPVPVVALELEQLRPGGAGHVAASLAGLGCQVTLAGVLGTDTEGMALRSQLAEAGVSDLALVQHAALSTITKTRVLAGPHHQLLRLDREDCRSKYADAASSLEQMVLPQIPRHAVVILADYDKGTLPPATIRRIVAECGRHDIPCLVDPKKTDFSAYQGATLLTPNVLEAERALVRQFGSAAAVAAAAVELRDNLDLDATVITRGADGMTAASAEGIQHFPAEFRQVADVTGAGDTVVATLAACLALHWHLADACRLAGLAAGIAVGRPGTYVVRAEELARAWHSISPKIVNAATAGQQVATARQAGRRVVFTNGCFDILHAGHLRCLEKARQMGQMLVVGLNSDVSVRRNKGDARPIIGEQHRAALLAGLACVDLVVLFDERTPESLIRCLQPDALVKGGDYDPDWIAGADFVRGRGGEVVTIPLLNGLSTTSILQASHAQDT